MKKNEQRRKGIVRFISLYLERYGYPPSVREIAQAAQVVVKGAWRYLHVLAREGLLTIQPRVARSVRVTAAGRDYAALFPSQAGGQQGVPAA